MSNFDQKGKQRARFAVESTYGEDATDDVSTNFFDLRHEDVDLKLDPQILPDPTVVQRDFQQYDDVIGPTRASAQISCVWTGTGQALASSITPTKRAQSKIMEALLGGYHAGAGSTVSASPSPSSTGFSVSPGDGTEFTEGTMIAVVVNGVPHARYLRTVSTDALTVWPALPAAPGAGAIVYNSQSIFLTGQPSTQIQMMVEAAKQRGNIFLGLGGQGDFTLDLTRGQIAKWGSTIKFAKYLHDDEFATPQGGSAIALASYDDTGPIHATAGLVHLGPIASTTLNPVNAAAVSINFARTWLEQGLHSGVEGLDAWELDTRQRRIVEITLRKPDPWEDYHDGFAARTQYGLVCSLGAAGGAIRSVCVPTMTLCKAPENADAYGVKGLKLTFLVKESALCSSQASEIQRSPIVLGHV